MKPTSLLIAICAVAATCLAGCVSCPEKPVAAELGLINRLEDRDDPYIYAVCQYFKEANARWPSNSAELVSFLRADYTGE